MVTSETLRTHTHETHTLLTPHCLSLHLQHTIFYTHATSLLLRQMCLEFRDMWVPDAATPATNPPQARDRAGALSSCIPGTTGIF